MQGPLTEKKSMLREEITDPTEGDFFLKSKRKRENFNDDNLQTLKLIDKKPMVPLYVQCLSGMKERLW